MEGGGHDKEVASSKKVHSRLQCKNRYPIYGQNRYPIYDQNGWKTLPFGAAHTYIAHIREYPPPPGRLNTKIRLTMLCLKWQTKSHYGSWTNWLQILKTTENKWINIDCNCLFLTCAHDRNEGNTHNHEHAAILPTDAFKLQISTQKGALQVVLFLERQGKN